MALRRPIGSAALRSAAYLHRVLSSGADPSRGVLPTVPPSNRPPLANFSPCRAFAAPSQVKKKQKEASDDGTGPRINNTITSPFVRLVTDQGHRVLPRHEALQLAARLNQDLVEVQRKADPPVCKIMDFHKEKYKKEVKEKERLKTKSALVLRGGENKEVRFKGKTMKRKQRREDAAANLFNTVMNTSDKDKMNLSIPKIERSVTQEDAGEEDGHAQEDAGVTVDNKEEDGQEGGAGNNDKEPSTTDELKDLKVKADAITRLMERGYRVKCTAIPSGNGEEDLGALLSSLLGLIQDVCIVESGPHLDTRHAYVIVRHAKFAAKKTGKKASKAMEDAGRGTRNTASETPVSATDSGETAAIQDDEWEQAESDSEVDDRANSDHVGKMPMRHSTESYAPKEGQSRGFGRELDQSKSHLGNSSERQTVGPGVGLRKAKLGMEKQEKNNQDTPAAEMNRYAARRQQIKGENNQSSSQGRFPQDPRRNENEVRCPVSDNRRPFQQHNRPLPSPNDGRFDLDRSPPDPRRNVNGGYTPLDYNRRQSGPLNCPLPPAGDAGNATPTKSFGIFSTPKSATATELRNTKDPCTSKPDNPDLPKTYGVSSFPRRAPDDDKSSGNKTADGPTSNSSPTPKFGIFGTKRPATSKDRS